jgi:FtsP/CotA-like multicopper oxidase with cupredoxin domain
MQVSRRTFLKTALGAIISSGLPIFPAAYGAPKKTARVREFHFSASPTRVNLGAGPDFTAWTFNGQIPGPEIRVKEGETIRVVLKNYLPEGTTIHWHGLPVPNNMDGVPELTQNAVMPGEIFVYEFQARPAGSYIYHSHAKYQLDQGLYGPLIIEPSNPRDSYDREYTLVLEDWVMKDGGGVANTRRRPPMGMMGHMMGGMRGRGGGFPPNGSPLLEPIYDAYAVNGRVYPEVEPLVVARGDKVKLRLLNPSSATIYDLMLAGHALTITHMDGRQVRPLETDVLRIGMGERYDVEFVADNPGTWLLGAAEKGAGEGMLRIPVQYQGVQRKEPIPPLFQPQLRLANYWDFQSPYPTDELAAGNVSRFYSQVLSGGMMGSPFWTINGFVYPNAERLGVTQGERVQIEYWNRSMMPHPMHLHGHFFKVVNPALPRSYWIQKDTVIVNPMQRVEIEFMADNPGRWFHHCHNLYHMEAGMANVLDYEP